MKTVQDKRPFALRFLGEVPGLGHEESSEYDEQAQMRLGTVYGGPTGYSETSTDSYGTVDDTQIDD